MVSKIQVAVVIAFAAILSIEICTAHRVCTLDDMKLLAAEACESLFQNNVEHSKHKRDTSNKVSSEDGKSPHDEHDIHRHTKVRVHRRDYPKGGYLLINHRHAKVLHRLRHDPEYRIMPLRQYQKKMLEENGESQEGVRGKRENSDQYSINVPYCCVNKCRMDFFCRS